MDRVRDREPIQRVSAFFSSSTPNNNTVAAPVQQINDMSGRPGASSNIIASSSNQPTRPSGALDTSILPVKAEPCARCQTPLTAENNVDDDPTRCNTCYAEAMISEFLDSIATTSPLSRPQKIDIDSMSPEPTQQKALLFEHAAVIAASAEQANSSAEERPNVAPTSNKRYPEVVKCQFCRKPTGPENRSENRHICTDCFKAKRNELENCSRCGFLSKIYNRKAVKCLPCYDNDRRKKRRQQTREKPTPDNAPATKRNRLSAPNASGNAATLLPPVSSNVRVIPSPASALPSAQETADSSTSHEQLQDQKNVEPVCKVCDAPPFPPNQWSSIERVCEECYLCLLHDERIICVDCHQMDECDESGRCKTCATHNARIISRQRFIKEFRENARARANASASGRQSASSNAAPIADGSMQTETSTFVSHFR